jgi:hypothetical protein
MDVASKGPQAADAPAAKGGADAPGSRPRSAAPPPSVPTVDAVEASALKLLFVQCAARDVTTSRSSRSRGTRTRLAPLN